MSRVSTRSVQRKITHADLQFAGYLRAPHHSKPTALGLWVHTDGLGRRELVPELIAAAIYPGEAATERVIEHLLMLDECGFLTIYQAQGAEWIELRRPLRVDQRLAASECPEPIREHSRTFAAVGGAGERARERVERERVERAAGWSGWEGAQERLADPMRPMLLDAPPLGCPDHPSGSFADCGPCGTARRRHDRWVAQERYSDQVRRFEESRAGEL